MKEAKAAPLDVASLFQNLVNAGLISKTPTEATTATSKPSVKENPFALLANRDFLRKRQPSAIDALYTGMQCSNCCIRFPGNETTKYNEHLDFHFRENRREKEAKRRCTYQKWYCNTSDWIKYQQIEYVEEREMSWFEQQQIQKQSTMVVETKSTEEAKCTAGDDKMCGICNDLLEIFYDDDDEEWMLRNAIRVEGQVYHPGCYRDSIV